MKKTSSPTTEFCRDVVRALELERKYQIKDALKEWASMSKDYSYSNLERTLANIKTIELKEELRPNKKMTMEKETEYKSLNDSLAMQFYSLHIINGDKASIEERISHRLDSIGYTGLAKFVGIMSTGHRHYQSEVEESRAHKRASNNFKKIGAVDVSHHALAMYYLSLIKQQNSRGSLSLIRKAAKEFRVGNAHTMYNFVLGLYYEKLADVSKTPLKKCEYYKVAANYFAHTNEKHDLNHVMARYHFQQSRIQKSLDDELDELRKSAEYFRRIQSKQFEKINGLIHLRMIASDLSLQDKVRHLRTSAKWFRKYGNMKMHYHTLAQYYYASHILVSGNKKVRYLRLASRYYRLAGVTAYHHKTLGMAYNIQAHQTKDIRKQQYLFKLTTSEYKNGGWIKEYENGLGIYNYYSAVLSSEGTIPFFLESSKHFMKAGNDQMAAESAGHACIRIALESRTEEMATNAIELFQRSSNETMLAASKMLLFEIKASNETDNDNRREFYYKSAASMRTFIDRIFSKESDDKMKNGLPGMHVVSNLKERMEAHYEHYMGLGTQGLEQ